MTDLGTLPGDPCSSSQAINSKGQIVGASEGVCFEASRGFLWENGGPMLDLNGLIPSGSGVQLTNAVDINDRGEIVGYGPLPNGDTHAILLIPCQQGDEDCADNAEGTTAATQNNLASVTQRPAPPTPANAALSDRLGGLLDRLRGPRFPWYHVPGTGTAPQN